MTAANLGVCIGQSVLCLRGELNPTTAVKVPLIVQHMITHFPAIFGPEALTLFDNQGQGERIGLDRDEPPTTPLSQLLQLPSISATAPVSSSSPAGITTPHLAHIKASSVDSDNCSSTGSTCKDTNTYPVTFEH